MELEARNNFLQSQLETVQKNLQEAQKNLHQKTQELATEVQVTRQLDKILTELRQKLKKREWHNHLNEVEYDPPTKNLNILSRLRAL